MGEEELKELRELKAKTERSKQRTRSILVYTVLIGGVGFLAWWFRIHNEILFWFTENLGMVASVSVKLMCIFLVSWLLQFQCVEDKILPWRDNAEKIASKEGKVSQAEATFGGAMILASSLVRISIYAAIFFA